MYAAQILKVLYIYIYAPEILKSTLYIVPVNVHSWVHLIFGLTNLCGTAGTKSGLCLA